MPLQLCAAHRHGPQAGIKLARLLELPERELERRVAELEADPRFPRLVEAGVVSIERFPNGRFASRRFGGWGVRTCTDGLGPLLDSHGELAVLMRQIGQEHFETHFLNEDGLPEPERARLCGLEPIQARRLRELLDRFYIKAELETAAAPAPAKSCSAVAGVAIEAGRPALGFFNREIWKGRYRVDQSRLLALRQSLSHREYRGLERHLRQLELIDRRKTTLYRVLEELLALQAEYLVNGDPARRRALTQRELCRRLDIAPSVLSRLIAAKSVQLPWGLEAPLKSLFPSAKSLLREQLHGLALSRPELCDRRLVAELRRLAGARLSRRSIAQYRQELGLKRTFDRANEGQSAQARGTQQVYTGPACDQHSPPPPCSPGQRVLSAAPASTRRR